MRTRKWLGDPGSSTQRGVRTLALCGVVQARMTRGWLSTQTDDFSPSHHQVASPGTSNFHSTRYNSDGQTHFTTPTYDHQGGKGHPNGRGPGRLLPTVPGFPFSRFASFGARVFDASRLETGGIQLLLRSVQGLRRGGGARRLEAERQEGGSASGRGQKKKKKGVFLKKEQTEGVHNACY